MSPFAAGLVTGIAVFYVLTKLIGATTEAKRGRAAPVETAYHHGYYAGWIDSQKAGHGTEPPPASTPPMPS